MLITRPDRDYRDKLNMEKIIFESQETHNYTPVKIGFQVLLGKEKEKKNANIWHL